MAFYRNGHKVTIFERGYYDYKEAGNMDKLDRDKTYPIDIGAKGCRAIDYLEIRSFFNKHCNRFTGTMSTEGFQFGPQESLEHAGYMGARLEIMWALNEA